MRDYDNFNINGVSRNVKNTKISLDVPVLLFRQDTLFRPEIYKNVDTINSQIKAIFYLIGLSRGLSGL